MSAPLPRAAVRPSFLHVGWKGLTAFAVLATILLVLLERGEERATVGVVQGSSRLDAHLVIEPGDPPSEWIQLATYGANPGDMIKVRYRTGAITGDHTIEEITVLRPAPGLPVLLDDPELEREREEACERSSLPCLRAQRTVVIDP